MQWLSLSLSLYMIVGGCVYLVVAAVLYHVVCAMPCQESARDSCKLKRAMFRCVDVWVACSCRLGGGRGGFRNFEMFGYIMVSTLTEGCCCGGKRRRQCATRRIATQPRFMPADSERCPAPTIISSYSAENGTSACGRIHKRRLFVEESQVLYATTHSQTTVVC